MTDSIKITALTSIGANIAYTTVLPVVNVAGTAVTQKTSAQLLGNLILNGAGGSYFPAATQALTSQTVTNAAQPNITSVGTLSSLIVTANINAGNVNGGNIVTANFIYGDGRNLTNVNATGTYSNSNVAAYLPTYSGTVTAGNVYANSGTVRGTLLTGTLSTAAQPNITSVGTLTSLAVTANATGGNLISSGIIKVGVFNTGNIPSASTVGIGSKVLVTDATSNVFLATYTGGGGNTVPVFSNGSAWIIGG